MALESLVFPAIYDALALARLHLAFMMQLLVKIVRGLYSALQVLTELMLLPVVAFNELLV